MADERPVIVYATPPRFTKPPDTRPAWLRVLVAIEHTVYIAVATVVGLALLAGAAVVLQALLGKIR